MTSITALTHLTLSIGSAVSASTKNPCLGTVILAKGDEGTALVVERAFRNRRAIFYKAGYLRAGSNKTVWVETRELMPTLYLNTADGRTLDEVVCREICYRMMDAANASAKAKVGGAS